MADPSATLASAPDTLLSPTAARNLALTAKDWAAVSGWLAEKYAPSPVPAFERNDETLRALLALAECNRGADEREEEKRVVGDEALRLLVDAEAEGYTSSGEGVTPIALKGDRADILDAIEAGMEGEMHGHVGSGSGNGQQEGSLLDEIASTAVALGAGLDGIDGAAAQQSRFAPQSRVGDTDIFTSIDRAIVDLSWEENICSATICDVNTLQSYIDHELAANNERIPVLEALETASNTAVTPEQTTQWMREIRGLRRQVEAYDAKLKTLDWQGKQKSSSTEDDGASGPKIEDLVAMEEKAKRIFAELTGETGNGVDSTDGQGR